MNSKRQPFRPALVAVVGLVLGCGAVPPSPAERASGEHAYRVQQANRPGPLSIVVPPSRPPVTNRESCFADCVARFRNNPTRRSPCFGSCSQRFPLRPTPRHHGPNFP
jgi:hypothetical protein